MAAERLMVPKWEDAAENHRRRYEWAARQIGKSFYRDHVILDIACGCGYGTRYLAEQEQSWVVGCDISAEAIEYARAYHDHWTITYIHGEFPPDDTYTHIVCLETLEHVADPAAFLLTLAGFMDSDSLLLVSVPNETYAPCDPIDYPFHRRHYTPETLGAALAAAGLRVERWARQLGSEPGVSDVEDGSPDGLCILAVAVKVT